MTKDIGTFTLRGTSLRVTDPCYDRDTWCTALLADCVPGTWNASVELSDHGAWGNRVSSLKAVHSGNHEVAEWYETETEIGVDSGQAGIFDDDLYPDKENNGVFGDPTTFYGKACSLTSPAGCMDFGAVSSSGFGDGGYSCHYGRDKDGRVVEVEIIFISDDENEDGEEE